MHERDMNEWIIAQGDMKECMMTRMKEQELSRNLWTSLGDMNEWDMNEWISAEGDMNEFTPFIHVT